MVVMIEIERKFLIISDKWRDNIQSKNGIVQFYLSPKDHVPTVRLRSKGNCGYITVKYPSSSEDVLVRPEFEYEVPLADIKAQEHAAIGSLIRKTRHYVCDEFAQNWEIDVFESPCPGLVLAEIELSSAQEEIKFPAWVGEEVTKDRQYSNQVMSYGL
jgi:adenylate cyclase